MNRHSKFWFVTLYEDVKYDSYIILTHSLNKYILSCRINEIEYEIEGNNSFQFEVNDINHRILLYKTQFLEYKFIENKHIFEVTIELKLKLI